MTSNLFPRSITDEYRGHPVAKWVFVAMTPPTIGRSLAHIILPDGGVQSIATIPLDAFLSSAAAVVIGTFAQWGLAQWMFGLLYVLVLVRSQALIPLMWLFILIEYRGRLLLGVYKPFEAMGHAPGGLGT
jgi:hypothetical protein